MPLFRWLLLFFVITPIVEMYLLLTVGDHIGALPTIGLVLLTAVIGVSLLRQQGLATLTRAQQRIAEGTIPAAEMADGLLLAVAGPLLLTPGFLTDAMGFVLLVPGVRRTLGRFVSDRLLMVNTMGPVSGYQRTHFGSDVIEGEFRREDDGLGHDPQRRR